MYFPSHLENVWFWFWKPLREAMLGCPQYLTLTILGDMVVWKEDASESAYIKTARGMGAY